MRCGSCRRKVHLTAEGLAQQYGADLRLWRLLSRLRCDRPLGNAGPVRCGGKPGHVIATEIRVRGKGVTVLREVALLSAD